MCYTSKAIGPKAHNKTQYTLTLLVLLYGPRVVQAVGVRVGVGVGDQVRILIEKKLT